MTSISQFESWKGVVAIVFQNLLENFVIVFVCFVFQMVAVLLNVRVINQNSDEAIP